MDGRMAEALHSRELPSDGRARQISPQDLEDFDWIVTMDETNLADVRKLDPSGRYHHKIRPLVSFCRHHDALGVPDPYYGGKRGFGQVIDLLEDGCEGILESLRRDA
jgi:protein-tyrosine phosphatase